jgi:hypothetical protein
MNLRTRLKIDGFQQNKNMGFTLKELKRKYEKYSSIYVDEGILNENLTQEEMSELELRLESIKTLIEDYE